MTAVLMAMIEASAMVAAAMLRASAGDASASAMVAEPPAGEFCGFTNTGRPLRIVHGGRAAA